MGRKVHPYGFRLKVIRDWKSRWFAEGQEYADLLNEDREIRDLIFSHMRLRSRDGPQFPVLKLNVSLPSRCQSSSGHHVLVWSSDAKVKT